MNVYENYRPLKLKAFKINDRWNYRCEKIRVVSSIVNLNDNFLSNLTINVIRLSIELAFTCWRI